MSIVAAVEDTTETRVHGCSVPVVSSHVKRHTPPFGSANSTVAIELMTL